MTTSSINPDLNAITSSLFRVSAKLAVIQDDKILVVQEGQGWFGLPGGGVDHGEEIVEGLVREISEEIDQEISPHSIQSVPSIINSTAIFDGIPRLTLVYTLIESAPKLMPSRLELDFKWVSLEGFASLNLAPNIAPMREDILRMLSR